MALQRSTSEIFLYNCNDKVGHQEIKLLLDTKETTQDPRPLPIGQDKHRAVNWVHSSGQPNWCMSIGDLNTGCLQKVKIGPKPMRTKKEQSYYIYIYICQDDLLKTTSRMTDKDPDFKHSAATSPLYLHEAFPADTHEMDANDSAADGCLLPKGETLGNPKDAQ